MKQPSESVLQNIFSKEEMNPLSVDDVLKQSSFLSKIKQFEHIHSSPFEALSLDLQNEFILLRLQQLYQTLMVNPIWKKRFQEQGINCCPSDFVEWQNVPITDRDTLNELYMGEREGLVVPLSKGGFEVVASGGTSGGLPIETVYSLKELRDTYYLSGRHMDEFIFKKHFPSDVASWIVMTLSDYDMWSSSTMVGGVLQQVPSMNFIAAGPMSEVVYKHILSFGGPKAFLGMSREIEALAELGKTACETDRNSFELAIYGSGLLQDSKVEELKRIYPNLSILSYFASNQAEAIGLQHDHDAFLRTVPGLHFIEIVDDEGNWVDEGEEGELVITRLHATEAPVLRMQLGDRMIRRSNYESSRLNTQQIEFAGRSGDIIHIGESHYPAQKVLTLLYTELERLGINVKGNAAEIQFLNDRVSRHLSLLIGSESEVEIADHLERKLPGDEIRKLFISVLKHSLPLYDQNQSHFDALDNISYGFGIRSLSVGSPVIYKTKVNKVPLIKDII